MLCADEVINLNIDCPINATNGEFACVRISDIRLDINKIKDLVEPILRKIVNPPKDDGYMDLICVPASYLDARIPGISDISGVSCCCSPIIYVCVIVLSLFVHRYPEKNFIPRHRRSHPWQKGKCPHSPLSAFDLERLENLG